MKEKKIFRLKDKVQLVFAGFVIIAILALMAFTGGFDIPNWNEQQLMMNTVGSYSVVSATQANSALSFGTGIYSKHIIIENQDGTNEIYIDLNDTTATTSNIPIAAGAKLEIDFIANGIGIICDTGETATVLVIWTY